MDYQKAKPTLLQLLAKIWQSAVFTREPLGMTNSVSHYLHSKQMHTNPVSLLTTYHKAKKRLWELQQRTYWRKRSYTGSYILLQTWTFCLFWRMVLHTTQSCQFWVLNATHHYLLWINPLERTKQVFSNLDLLSGFWQISRDKLSKEIIVLSTPTGHCKWLTLLMGLYNALHTFQQMFNSLCRRH